MKKVQMTIVSLLVTGQVFSQAITDNGTNVGIGNASPIHKLDVNGDINMSTGNALLIGGNQVVSTGGSRNMFLGDGTGTNITTGGDNAVIGFKAGEFLDEGRFNTIIGFKAAQYMTTSLSNTIIGREAGQNCTGNQNVFIGRQAGQNAESGENTIIGDKAGLGVTTGSSNTLIGKDANVSNGILFNATAIGAGAVAGVSNSVILGNEAKVGIGTSSPGSKLHVHDQNFAFSFFTTSQTGTTPFADALVIGNQLSGEAFITNYEDEDLNLGTNGLDRLVITKNGNVGIGTNSPNGELEVSSAGEANIILNRVFSTSANVFEMSSGGNTDWKMMSPIGEHLLSFKNSAGGDVLSMSQSGNVGVNTTMPGSLLDVQGDAASTNDVSQITTNYAGNSDVRAIRVESTPADGYGFGIDAKAGYIGVKGAAEGGTYGGTTHGLYGFANGTAGTRIGVSAISSNTGGDKSYGVYGDASGATKNWAGFFDNGSVHVKENLSIGSEIVDDKLRISSNLDSKVSAKIIGDNAGDTSSLKLFESGDYGFELEYDGANDRLDLWSRNFSGNEAKRMSWLKDGKIGIGTASPDAHVHIISDKEEGFRLNQTVASLTDAYGGQIILTNTGTGDAHGFYQNITNTGGSRAYGTYQRVRNSGGNSSAYGTYQDVRNDNGNDQNQTFGGWFLASGSSLGPNYGIYSEAIGSGDLWAGWFWGDTYASGSYLPSDRILKTNIKELENASELVQKLKVHSYNYRIDEFPTMHLQEGERFGFIAQELKEVLPQLVKSTALPSPTRPDGTKGQELPDIDVVNYTELIPILTAAIQEQQTQIESLQPESSISLEEVESLKADNESLNEEVTELRAEIDQIKEMLGRLDTDLQQCCFNYDEGVGSSNVTLIGVQDSDAPILEQNAPNPFRENSVIKYYLPTSTRNATLLITEQTGTQLKSFNLEGKGFGQVLISGGSFSSGTYIYTLVINGERVSSKQMVLL